MWVQVRLLLSTPCLLLLRNHFDGAVAGQGTAATSDVNDIPLAAASMKLTPSGSSMMPKPYLRYRGDNGSNPPVHR